MSGLNLDEIVFASLSDVGLVRQANEDSCDQFRHPTGARLFVVADGMGGHRGGATASLNAVEKIGESFLDHSVSPPDSLVDAILHANRNVYELAMESPELRGMGTTAVCLLIAAGNQGGPAGWVAHVGDSRAYRYRDDEFTPITSDHSVVAAMVRQGLLTPEEAESHPRRNEILRSVGVEPEVEVEVNPVDIRPGDLFLLCSDGLSGLVSDSEMAAILEECSPSDAAQKLVDMANERGGTDNITLQIAALPRLHSAGLEATVIEEHKRSGSGIQWPLILGLAAIACLWLLFC